MTLLTFASSAYVIVPVFLWGLIWGKRRYFIVSLAVFFISAGLNSLLKGFFQIPMDPSLGLTHTWAFPSGHMQNTTALWGFLAMLYQKQWVLCIVVISLFLNALAIYSLGFHTGIDLIGGVYVAICLLFLVHVVERFLISGL